MLKCCLIIICTINNGSLKLINSQEQLGHFFFLLKASPHFPGKQKLVVCYLKNFWETKHVLICDANSPMHFNRSLCSMKQPGSTVMSIFRHTNPGTFLTLVVHDEQRKL